MLLILPGASRSLKKYMVPSRAIFGVPSLKSEFTLGTCLGPSHVEPTRSAYQMSIFGFASAGAPGTALVEMKKMRLPSGETEGSRSCHVSPLNSTCFAGCHLPSRKSERKTWVNFEPSSRREKYASLPSGENERPNSCPVEMMPSANGVAEL